MTIAFFDFDGTITRGDSFALFLKFILGKRFYIKILCNIHILFLYKLGIYNNAKTKQSVLESCLGGMEQITLEQKCQAFCRKLESYCKDSALTKIQWHKEQGHKVVLVSASFEEYLRPLCKKLGIELLATTMEVKNGIVTGNFGHPNCYGVEKVHRIKATYNLCDYTSIYVYGDTRGDKEMLELASKKQGFYRVFY
ncbi:HAD-IB family hydrolase [Helicobacter didelphidarum]|uniref:HAD-IB family hydrolase n=1 Tax=Helicobacter didelphidarum TaxID=2040648 RepID=A0A3D8IS00_9HELI|nr:HAD family hydrolase [Helicobacter didelphidarum]RDU67716.1 HAD-IB family hydrolase [Helicobacter didelphidarum]